MRVYEVRKHDRYICIVRGDRMKKIGDSIYIYLGDNIIFHTFSFNAEIKDVTKDYPILTKI